VREPGEGGEGRDELGGGVGEGRGGVGGERDVVVAEREGEEEEGGGEGDGEEEVEEIGAVAEGCLGGAPAESCGGEEPL